MSPDAQRNKVLKGVVNANDHISKLPDDVLLKILSKLLTEESVRTSTLSSRWVHLWKELPELWLDMTKISVVATPILTDAGRAMTKVIRDHRGHLEKVCIVHHSFQCSVGMIETWIQALVHTKHVRSLSLTNHLGHKRGQEKANTTLVLPPDSFTDPKLETLKLYAYNLEAPRGFNKCNNIRFLDLGVFTNIEVFSAMLASCTSVEKAILQICCPKKGGPLKIDNSKLKILVLSCYNIERIEVSTHSVNVLSLIGLSCELDDLVIANPNLQFNRSYRHRGPKFPHTSYYITCPPQGGKSTEHEFMLRDLEGHFDGHGSLSVKVDLLNTKEMEMLKEILATWPAPIDVLEIMFKKNNAPRGDDESFIEGIQSMFAYTFCYAHCVWLSNFSGSKEEFELASCLITQGMVVGALKITPICKSKNVEMKAAVEKLREVPTGHENFQVDLLTCSCGF